MMIYLKKLYLARFADTAGSAQLKSGKRYDELGKHWKVEMQTKTDIEERNTYDYERNCCYRRHIIISKIQCDLRLQGDLSDR